MLFHWTSGHCLSQNWSVKTYEDAAIGSNAPVAASSEEWGIVKESSDFGLIMALRKLKRTCKALKLCFLVATIVLSIFWIVVVATLLMGWLNGGAGAINAVLYAVLYGAFVVLILWNLTKLFDGVGREDAPFSSSQADRLQTIAVIALAVVILDFLISIGFIFEPAPEIGFGMVANNGVAEPTLNINIGMLAFSAIMYSLSAVFRYAALLQQLSDETV